MKTILYNPIFINPQAYYVFPRLTRWLRPDDSYKEPANYIGQIEVTIIAYGEIGYTEYFEHTNYIDFTNFSNSYVRISLFTRLGSCVLGEWKIGAMEGDRPYIEPEVLASLKAVVIVGDKTNQDKDRDIVANLVDASNPFIISNAAYKLNSGYGKYEVDFTTWSKRNVVTSNNDNSFSFESKVSSSLLYYNTTIGVDTPSFKIKANISNCLVYYYYINDKGTLSSISILESGEFELPISHNTLYNGNIGIGFEIGRINGTGTGTITQIPSYQSAFVTDGVNDLVMSTKTVQEMLGGSNEITVVSMIHQIADRGSTYPNIYNNQIRYSTRLLRSTVTAANVVGKTGIYGYTATGVSITGTPTGKVVNDILGDKNDYPYLASAFTGIDAESHFSVEGYLSDSGNIIETSKVAWYWTIIANKVLTTDQINQVIAYYNLDRCVEPTVWYDVQKQGLSNDTPDSDWYLKDFSKNGFDMSLFNFAKKLDSGIGKYGMDFLEWKSNSGMNFTSTKLTSTKPNLSGGWLTFRNVSGLIPETKVKVSGAPREFVFIGNNNGTDDKFSVTINNGVYTIPEFTLSSASGFYINNNSGDWSNLVIEQIPSHAGALCFDGVNDYGKVTGLPIYKDYTFIIDYERISYTSEGWGGAIVSKSPSANNGAFISMMANSAGLNKQLFSFGGVTAFIKDDLSRILFWQTKYKSENTELTVGEGVDGDTLWLGTLRDKDLRFFNGAIYSLMSFPYSLSEFLIERQLKKHKLGTLYPDMVEFRPIVNSNVEWNTIEIWQADKPLYRPAIGTNETGTYLQKDSTIGIYVKPKGVDEVTKIVVNGTEYTNLKINSNGFYYVTLPITTSPQKIDITIDEYIRYEDIDFTDCYPGVPRIYVDDKSVTWGNKLKVGDKFTFYGNVNILPEMYNVLVKAKYNGEEMTYGSIGTITKSMAFTSFRTYTFDNNEPKCILSPSRLRIPNSSYKILGYIPDISGHGNHGKINNSAYAEGSGVNADGSYQLDGVDDFITIPTTVGGKQVLMKVNWQSSIGQGMLYDQRGTAFAIWNSDKYNDDETDTIPAYSARNGGNTYIDGILNKNILASQLRNITHNIVATNTMLNGSSVSPTIGCRTEHDAYFTNMSLYDFMLFDEIDSDEEILTLNEYVGIEGNTDDLFN